jgi:hypothetical protein
MQTPSDPVANPYLLTGFNMILAVRAIHAFELFLKFFLSGAELPKPAPVKLSSL